jgi:PAS domain S-box-containing protein
MVARMTVLVVDDDEASRYLLASLLRGHGHEVVEARDGREALEAARSRPVDLVVTDILMPVMDGYTLAREWKADEKLALVPLIFYTASYTEPADRRFADSLGADGFYVKPQEPDALIRIVDEALARREQRLGEARTAQKREESEVLREYSERLVSKLEQKVVEASRANEDLRQAIEVLSDEVDVKKTLIEQLTSDIANREQAEADLRAANETLQTVVAASPLPIVALDLDLVVTVWNPAAERLLGWSAEDAIGRRYPPLSDEEVTAFMDEYGPLMSGEVDAVESEVRRRRRDGTEVDLHVNAGAFHDVTGAVTGVLSIFEDVTLKRHVEMVKSDFVSMVSHELRTPLTSIIGYSDLLEQIDLREKPELFHQLLGKIRDRGDRMRRLIDDLLSVSQVQSGPLRLDLDRTDIAEFVRLAVAKAEMTPQHRLVVDAEGGLPPVLIDQERMGAVLAHLVSNAVKYSPDGGDVTVRVAADGSDVRIEVGDHGIGIDSADMAHVFDRFTQADMSDTRSFGGVGVGLYLARHTVEAHRGRVEAQSAPGEGSTFAVILPAAP